MEKKKRLERGKRETKKMKKCLQEKKTKKERK